MVPPAGEWAEVVTATPKWIVVQNARGQQFPISTDSIGLFLIRWPTDAERIDAADWIEATGYDIGSNQMVTDHVDVYRGRTKALVQPIFASQSANGAINNNFNVQVNLQFNLFQPMMGVGGGPMIPDGNRGWMHIVGPTVGFNPLRLAINGNNAISVFPVVGGLHMFQVTEGSPNLLRPGDLLYVVSPDANPRSLLVTQLVGYKAIPVDQFVR